MRKGDLVGLEDGSVAEVLSVVTNNEGGLDVTMRVAASRDELSRTVLRKGGPDERDEDKSTHFEDYDSEYEEYEDDYEGEWDEEDDE